MDKTYTKDTEVEGLDPIEQPIKISGSYETTTTVKEAMEGKTNYEKMRVMEITDHARRLGDIDAMIAGFDEVINSQVGTEVLAEQITHDEIKTGK